MLMLSAFTPLALLASISLTLLISPLLFCQRTRSFKDSRGYHRNEDGITTGPVQHSFDRQSRIQILGLILCSAFGLVINTFAAVFIRKQADAPLEGHELIAVSLKASATVSRKSLGEFEILIDCCRSV